MTPKSKKKKNQGERKQGWREKKQASPVAASAVPIPPNPSMSPHRAGGGMGGGIIDGDDISESQPGHGVIIGGGNCVNVGSPDLAADSAGVLGVRDVNSPRKRPKDSHAEQLLKLLPDADESTIHQMPPSDVLAVLRSLVGGHRPRRLRGLSAKVLTDPDESLAVSTSNSSGVASVTDAELFVQQTLLELLREVRKKVDSYGFFSGPVDPIKSNALDYYDVIDRDTEAMDLDTMENAIKTGVINTVGAFESNLQRIIHCCRKYNTDPGHFVRLEGDKIESLAAPFIQRAQRKIAQRLNLSGSSVTPKASGRGKKQGRVQPSGSPRKVTKRLKTSVLRPVATPSSLAGSPSQVAAFLAKSPFPADILPDSLEGPPSAVVGSPIATSETVVVCLRATLAFSTTHGMVEIRGEWTLEDGEWKRGNYFRWMRHSAPTDPTLTAEGNFHGFYRMEGQQQHSLDDEDEECAIQFNRIDDRRFAIVGSGNNATGGF